MQTIQEVESKLRAKLEKTYTKPGKGASGSIPYLKVGAVAFAMNEAFGPCGWDVILDKVKIIKDAHKINGAGMEDASGAYWNAIVYAIVTVKARSLFRPDGTYVEVARQDVAVGSSVGGKQKTAVDAIQNALTSAATNAMKRACRFFGPKTGLTLQFEPGERVAVQRQLDAMEQENDSAADIEGTADPASEVGEITVSSDGAATAAAAPAVQAPAAPTNGTDHGSEALAAFAPADLLARIKALASTDTAVPMDDVKAFHKSMATAFGPKEATGLWTTAGVALGTPGLVVRRGDIFGVAQVLEEAAAGQGGLEAFFAQFRPKPAEATAPKTQAPAQPAAPQKPVEGVKYDAAALAAAGQAAPVAQAPAPVAQAAAAAPETHGEQVQKTWDDSELGLADRRKRYSKIFGAKAPEVVEILAKTPDDTELSREDAAKVHGVGLKIIQEMNFHAADVYALWKKAGYVFSNGGGQPRGRQARQFADALPQ